MNNDTGLITPENAMAWASSANQDVFVAELLASIHHPTYDSARLALASELQRLYEDITNKQYDDGQPTEDGSKRSSILRVTAAKPACSMTGVVRFIREGAL